MGELDFIVYGSPAPQGSKTAFANHYQDARRCGSCHRNHLVSISQVESSKAVKPWRALVTDAAKTAVFDAGQENFPVTGAVLVRVVFSLERPKGHYRTGRFAHELRPDAPARPDAKKLDLDKLCRAVLDALTGTAFTDDSLVVELAASKVYAGGRGRRVLDRPGAWICVSPVKNGIPA